MSFLQPAILWALPAIALPIVIHLINQRRFQTIPFGAMQFLLAADRMSKGYARLRQWLILAARTLAIAALLIAISRPLSTAWPGGWLGIAAGGDQNTSIILLDRSPSMSQTGPGGISKRSAGLRQISESLQTLNPSSVVLIASGDPQAYELESIEDLSRLPQSKSASSTADLPAMLDAAYQYISVNRPTRCDVWIVSDLRQSDWQPDNGRWSSLRSAFASLPQSIDFHLLAFTQQSTPDLKIRVTKTSKVSVSDTTAIQLSLQIQSSGSTEESAALVNRRVPIQLELDGASSETNVELTGERLEVANQLIPIDVTQTRGWGRVSIPSDRNPDDNEFFFVYDDPQTRRSLIVSEDPSATRPLQVAASISPDSSIICQAETIRPETFATTPLEDVSLILWQAPLPGSGDAAVKRLQEWSSDGGAIIFFPPEQPSDNSVAQIAWQEWKSGSKVATWVDDQDLLSDTQAGSALPLGDLDVQGYCELNGSLRPLATLSDGGVLLGKLNSLVSDVAVTDAWPSDANLYFFSTTIAESSLASDGVVLFALIHRALQQHSNSRDRTRIVTTEEVRKADPTSWQVVTAPPGVLSNTYHRQAGVFRDGERLFALNRTEQEDRFDTVSSARAATLFEGLEFDIVNADTESTSSLVREIWRLFLLLMLAALLIESILSVPKVRNRESAVGLLASTKRSWE